MSIGLTTVVLFAVFGILLFLSCPISVSIIIASIVTAVSSLSWDQITFITMQKMNSGVESFSLLAIPLFILAGNIMNNGGIARRLVNFSKLFVGWIPGSLAQANIVGNMLFGALSGSSVAAASAMGGCIYPIQKDEGYDPAFATAVNIASAPTGLLIPPTSAFIVYSTVAGGVSISTLFMAGYIPGILMGVGSMVVAFIYAKKQKNTYERGDQGNLRCYSKPASYHHCYRRYCWRYFYRYRRCWHLCSLLPDPLYLLP